MKIVKNFLNELAPVLDKKYFPDVKWHHDNKNTQKIHYACECFSNGVLTYEKLIKQICSATKDTQENIHNIVSKYITDFENYLFVPTKK